MVHLPGPERLWPLLHVILCSVCSSGGECSHDDTLSHLSSPCSRSEVLSQRTETLDYIPERHMKHIYVSRDDCADISLPFVNISARDRNSSQN